MRTLRHRLARARQSQHKAECAWQTGGAAERYCWSCHSSFAPGQDKVPSANNQPIISFKSFNSASPMPASSATPFEHIAVLGAGAWGTALALAALAAGRKTTLWVREADVLARNSKRRRKPFPAGPQPAQGLARDGRSGRGRESRCLAAGGAGASAARFRTRPGAASAPRARRW